eukprot:6187984-Pleurochrysis_carterae.AAC.4
MQFTEVGTNSKELGVESAVADHACRTDALCLLAQHALRDLGCVKHADAPADEAGLLQLRPQLVAARLTERLRVSKAHSPQPHLGHTRTCIQVRETAEWRQTVCSEHAYHPRRKHSCLSSCSPDLASTIRMAAGS